MKCCCESTLEKFKNIHYKNLPISAHIVKDSEGFGIVIFDMNLAIACFEINYCPMCGKKLNLEGEK